MLVFISWSGKKSQVVAEALKVWLAQVVQAVETWISSDIEKGARWNPELSKKLGESGFGIICLTRDNLDARWILFEAGALSKITDAQVCTLLIDVTPAEVEQPLSQFQHTSIEKADIRKLVNDINEAVSRMGRRKLSDEILNEIFETYWPKLQSVFQGIEKLGDNDIETTRSDREILEEMLEILRIQERERYRIRKTAYTTSLEAFKSWIKFRGNNVFAKHKGVLHYMLYDAERDIDMHNGSVAVINKENDWLITSSNAKVAVVDTNGRELEKYPLTHGDRIKIANGSDVEAGDLLVEYDPNFFPILSDVAGLVKYGDIIDSVTVIEDVDKVTGLSRKIITNISGDWRPRIAIKDEAGRTVNLPFSNSAARYFFPVGSYIIVDEGVKVRPGDTLGKIRLFPVDA